VSSSCRLLRLWINGAYHQVSGLRCSRFAAAFVGYAARVSESVSMRFPPQFLDELRARLPVSEVVGRRVKLKRQGREFVGLSPFNEEKTPSFTVNDQKGFFHDFSSGKHGDIFNFVMETEGVAFPEAVERLASLAGVAVPQPSKQQEAREEHRKTLHDIVSIAAAFFVATLASPRGAKARDYLAGRGIKPEVQRQFGLGFAASERFALKEHLSAKGIAVGDMIEAGLLIGGDEIAVPYDRFRGRVMFPIGDWRGRAVAFGGRALDPEVSPKYLNSPETALFHKGATLYNGAAARQAAHRGATVIVVEGYVDVIAMVGAGYEATVAPLGTALTADQLHALWKLADEPVLCFDGDKAGLRAAYRAIDLALPQLKPGRSLRFAMLPQGQDPDDLVRSGGRPAVDEVLGVAQPLSNLLWQRETAAGTLDTPERRAALEARLTQLIGSIADEGVRRHYRHDLEARMRRLLELPDPGIRRPRANPRTAGSRERPRSWADSPPGHDRFSFRSPRLASSPIVRGGRTAMLPREALILITLINHPFLLAAHAEGLAELEFRHPEADRLRRAILDQAHDQPDEAALRQAIASQGLGGVLSRVEAALTHRSDWPARMGAAPDDVAAWWTHVVTLHRKSSTLNRELKDAEQALGTEPTEENLMWLRDVQERLAAIEGTEALIEGFGASSGRAVRSL
jgi:DNA primase